jgi:hypothetical protein
MTILFASRILRFQEKFEILSCNKIVISTGAERSGEICGSFRWTGLPYFRPFTRYISDSSRVYPYT